MFHLSFFIFRCLPFFIAFISAYAHVKSFQMNSKQARRQSRMMDTLERKKTRQRSLIRHDLVSNSVSFISFIHSFLLSRFLFFIRSLLALSKFTAVILN